MDSSGSLVIEDRVACFYWDTVYVLRNQSLSKLFTLLTHECAVPKFSCNILFRFTVSTDVFSCNGFV